MIPGIVAVPVAAIGQVVGGYVCKRFKLGVKGMLKFSLTASCIALLLVPGFLARCPNTQKAGVTISYPG